MKQETKRLLAVNALYALIPVLLLLIPRLFAKAELEAYSTGYNTYMVLVEFGVIVLPTLLYFLTPWGRSVARQFWAKKPGTSLLLMIPLAFCAYFAINGVTVVWFLILQALGATSMPQTIVAPQTGTQLGIGLAIIALSPALCEEFFFRGTLQPMLHRQMKPWPAILLGGCLFGLVHGQLAALPSHILLGVGLCLVAYWTRSIWYTVVWHVMQNGIAVVISYFSGAILQASESMTGMDSTAVMAEQPLLMLISAGSMIAMFGAGTALFLVLLWVTTRRQRMQPIEHTEEKPQWLAWIPLVIAAGCIVYMYATSGISMMGGGA